MLKACTLIKRKPGMAVDAFQGYWLGAHSDIVKKLPFVKQYVQSHPLLGGYRKQDLIYDGLAEIWVDDTEALRALAYTEAYQAVREDEEKFIDPQGTTLLLTEEHVIKDGIIPKNGVKSIELVTRKNGTDAQSFQDYWKNIHGPIASQMPTVQRYVQSHTKLAGYKRTPQPKWDGIAITWFDSVDQMREGVGTPEFEDTLADGINFADTTSQHLLITKEHFIIE